MKKRQDAGKNQHNKKQAAIRVYPSEMIYVLPDKGIFRYVKQREELKAQKLWELNEVPHIVSIIETAMPVDGNTIWYEILIGENTTPVLLSHEEVIAGKYANKVQVSGLSSVSKRSLYADCILAIVRDTPSIPRVQGLFTTGLHEIDGVYCFVLPDGTILTHENVPVNARILSHMVSTSRDVELLKERASMLQEQTPSLEELFSFLQIVTLHGETSVLIGVAIRSLTYMLRSRVFKVGYPVILEGEQNTGKTSLARLISTLIYPYDIQNTGDNTFRDTVTRVELNIGAKQSMPFFIDDNPDETNESSTSIAAKRKIIDSIARSTSDGTPVRSRSNAKLEKQLEYFARTMPVFTAEKLKDLPASTLSRSVVLPIGENTFTRFIEGTPTVIALNTYAATLLQLGERVIRGMLSLLQEYGFSTLVTRLQEIHTCVSSQFEQSLKERWQEKTSLPLHHEVYRLIRSYADILVGTLIADGIAMGTSRFYETAYTCLLDAALLQLLGRYDTIEETGVAPFTNLILTLLDMVAQGSSIQGKYYKCSNNKNDCPIIENEGDTLAVSTWGYVQERGKLKPRYSDAETLFYVHDNMLLIPSKTKDILFKMRDTPLINTRDISRLAKEEGILLAGTNGKTDKQVWINGTNSRYTALNLQKLLAYRICDTHKHEDAALHPNIVEDVTSILKDIGDF